ncbi:hypothetical protein NPIL_26361 [Nephila pilipes]|uniref:Uncharacterized protein n=1 Tax=Nephila pilipes TaxID=299642 RepID=A0A8X6JJ52_NEPPI|nr:hypothetical protein NPIL_26361 [Nephila pilipes]
MRCLTSEERFFETSDEETSRLQRTLSNLYTAGRRKPHGIQTKRRKQNQGRRPGTERRFHKEGFDLGALQKDLLDIFIIAVEDNMDNLAVQDSLSDVKSSYVMEPDTALKSCMAFKTDPYGSSIRLCTSSGMLQAEISQHYLSETSVSYN